MTETPVVTRARVRVLRAEVDDGIAMSFAPLKHRTMVLVELTSADGVVGYGESWANYPSWAPAERVATLADGVFPLVVGEKADAGLSTWLIAMLGPIGRQWGAPGPIMQAISAVDVAGWDMRGKVSGMSVSRLLAHRRREQIPVYGSGVGPSDVTTQAAECRAAGHTAIKVKIGFGRERDSAILADARAQIGDNIPLYADANQAWSVAEAIAMASVLKQFDVAWIEEPIAGNRLADLEEFHRATGLPIATGENVYGEEEFRRYIDSPAVGVVQPDVAKAGGLTELAKICEYAEAAGKPVMPHLYGGAVAYAATLQLAAGQTAVSGVEFDIRTNPMRDPLMIAPPEVSGGRATIPDAPGLGIELDSAAIAALEVTEYERELRL
jgi:L-alanine-DL-glutamate epimerase-like enolase superfamily enzyme